MIKNSAFDKTGLQFFGEITSSITHEIKNSLAIVNENAGLLEDYTLMADKGVPLDPERLKNLAGKIKGQIQRIDQTIKRLNRFAHSSEESLKRIDVNDIAAFVISLSERFAFIRGVTLNHEQGESSEKILSNSFLLENLIWGCLEMAMDLSGEDKTVTIVSESDETGGRIRFTQLDELKYSHEEVFNGEKLKNLAGSLNAELKIDEEFKEIVLFISKKPEQPD